MMRDGGMAGRQLRAATINAKLRKDRKEQLDVQNALSMFNRLLEQERIFGQCRNVYIWLCQC
jgi:hypothetical protein